MFVAFLDRHPHNEPTLVLCNLVRNFAAWLATQTGTVSSPLNFQGGSIDPIRSGEIPWDIASCVIGTRLVNRALSRSRSPCLIAIRSIASRSIAFQTSIDRTIVRRACFPPSSDFPAIPVSWGGKNWNTGESYRRRVSSVPRAIVHHHPMDFNLIARVHGIIKTFSDYLLHQHLYTLSFDTLPNNLPFSKLPFHSVETPLSQDRIDPFTD